MGQRTKPGPGPGSGVAASTDLEEGKAGRLDRARRRGRGRARRVQVVQRLRGARRFAVVALHPPRVGGRFRPGCAAAVAASGTCVSDRLAPSRWSRLSRGSAAGPGPRPLHAPRGVAGADFGIVQRPALLRSKVRPGPACCRCVAPSASSSAPRLSFQRGIAGLRYLSSRRWNNRRRARHPPLLQQPGAHP